MVIWDGLKALFFVVIGLAVLILLPFIMTAVIGLFVLFLAVALIIGYAAYKKEERAIAKANAARAAKG